MSKRPGRLVEAFLIALVVILVPSSIAAHPGSAIAVDRQGQIFFLDTGSGLWRIDSRGNIAHLSETLFHWLALDEDNRFAGSQLPSGARGDVLRVGASPATLISSDYPIAVGQDGNLYYPSASARGLQLVRLLPSGATSVPATLPPAISGRPIAHVNGLSSGPANSIYYTENNVIRRITAQGRIGIVVTVPKLAKGPSIPGNVEHPYLRGLAVDARGVMYVADSADARVLKITPDGKITTLVKTESPWAPTAVALFGADVYVLEFLHTLEEVRRNWLPRVRKISPDGTTTIILTVDQMPGAR